MNLDTWTFAVTLFSMLVVILLTTVDSATIKVASTYHQHFRNPTKEPPRLTCWTCPNKADNEACNSWAPNTPCALSNHTLCMTVHTINVHTGISISVDKMCATSEQCNSDTVGCQNTATSGVQKCTSCCTSSYCNEPVPANHTSALRLSADLSSFSITLHHSSHLVFLPLAAIYTWISLL